MGAVTISNQKNYWDTPLWETSMSEKRRKKHRNNGHKHHCLKRDRLQCRLLVPLLKYLQTSTNKSLFFFLWKFSINTNLSIWHQRKSVIIVISPTIIYNMQPILLLVSDGRYRKTDCFDRRGWWTFFSSFGTKKWKTPKKYHKAECVQRRVQKLAKQNVWVWESSAQPFLRFIM